MRIRYMELPEPLREGGLEKAAADLARYLGEAGVEVLRGPGPVDAFGPVDLVHFHGMWSPGHYRAAGFCRSRGLPHVVSPHGMLEPWAWRHRLWKKWPYFHLVERRRLGRADALLATAAAEADNLRRFFPRQRIEVLALGVEPEAAPDYDGARRALGWPPGERVLVYLSRVHPKKGLKELLLALLEIIPEGAGGGGVRLVILGDGPAGYVAECRGLARRLGARMPVEWLPPQWGDAKWKYLQGADLFCLPTYSENFGIVVLEAGMVGTPVFTTTGTPWQPIADAGFGWVVAPDPANYPAVLRRFLALPDERLRALRRPFADWTRRHYAWPVLTGRYQAFYRQILEGRR